MHGAIRAFSNALLFRAPIASAIVLASFFSTGCAGGEDAADQNAEEAESQVDLCRLLTAGEVEQILGQSPGAATPGDEDVGQCTWVSAKGSKPVVVLTLDKAVLDSFDDFVAAFGEEFGGENPPRDRFHPVDGVGDWAMYVADDHEVRAFRGDRVLEVVSPSAEEAQIVELAKIAMGRLP